MPSIELPRRLPDRPAWPPPRPGSIRQPVKIRSAATDRRDRRFSTNRSRSAAALRHARRRWQPADCTDRIVARRALPRPARVLPQSGRGSTARDPGSPAGPVRRPAAFAPCVATRATTSAPEATDFRLGQQLTTSRPSRIASPERSGRVNDSTRGSRITLVEHQIDHMQHRPQPVGQLSRATGFDRESSRHEFWPSPARSAGPAWTER